MEPSQEPVLDWCPLPDDPSDVFALLSWRARLAPLIGHEVEKGKLITWARHSDSSARIRFLTGPGGAGKSRLAAELAETLRSQPGEPWTAGFLRTNGRLRIPDGRVLLVVDYPEERREFTKLLMQELAGEATQVRLLLLSRQPFEWWRNEIEAAHAGHLAAHQDIGVPNLSDQDALLLYRTVIERLRSQYPLGPGLQFDSDFQRWLARNRSLNALPLFITAAAIYAALNPNEALGYSGELVVRALISRELERLSGASREAGFPRPEGAARLAALAVVRGGFDGRMLRRFADPALELGISLPENIADDVHKLPWWMIDHWPPPSPDVVAAALLFEVLKQRSERASEWLWAAIQGVGTDVIDRLGRVTYDIRTIFGQDQERFTQWLVGMVRDRPERAIELAFLSEENRLPVGILPLAIAVGRALLSTAKSDEGRARILHNLATDLSNLGDTAGALEASEEALVICRRLASDNPRFVTRVALVLANLSNHRSELGEHSAALEAAQEAVEIYRRLAEDDPQAYESDLARSLNIESNCLSDAQRHEDALAAISESVDILRRLTTLQPALYEPELAGRLHSFSARLRDVGNATEALKVARESVEIFQRLVWALPARFEEELSTALHGLAKSLSAAGEFEDALNTIREAVAIRRRLAEERPARLLPKLTASLESMAHRLVENGCLVDARATAREATSLYRVLVMEQPGRFEDLLRRAITFEMELTDDGA